MYGNAPDPGERWNVNLPAVAGVVFVFLVGVVIWVVARSGGTDSIQSSDSSTTSLAPVPTPAPTPLAPAARAAADHAGPGDGPGHGARHTLAAPAASAATRDRPARHDGRAHDDCCGHHDDCGVGEPRPRRVGAHVAAPGM